MLVYALVIVWVAISVFPGLLNPTVEPVEKELSECGDRPKPLSYLTSSGKL
jgi:hypothetical protein